MDLATSYWLDKPWVTMPGVLQEPEKVFFPSDALVKMNPKI